MSATITTHGDSQVLTFELAEQQYCVSIDSISEIVDYEQKITTLPESPRHVEGVVDLRGRTTTVVNPKRKLGLDKRTDGSHIVVFDSESADENPTGWVVDEVLQVIGINDDDVNDSVDSRLTEGIIRGEDETFIIWLNTTEFTH